MVIMDEQFLCEENGYAPPIFIPDALGVLSPSTSEWIIGGELAAPFALADDPFAGELKKRGDEAATFCATLGFRGVP